MGMLRNLLAVGIVAGLCGLVSAQNPVDAVGSASAEMKIVSGSAWADSAVLTTYHKDSYAHHWIVWGPTLDYGDTLITPDTPRTTIVVLRDLTPSTTYRFRYTGDNPLNDSIESHSVAGSFTTTAATALRPGPSLLRRNTASFSIRQGRIITPIDLTPGDVVLFRNMTGRIVFAGLVHAGGGNSIALPTLAKAQYTVSVLRSGLTLSVGSLALP